MAQLNRTKLGQRKTWAAQKHRNVSHHQPEETFKYMLRVYGCSATEQQKETLNDAHYEKKVDSERAARGVARPGPK